MTKVWRGYHCGPMDWNWGLMRSLEDVAVEAAVSEKRGDDPWMEQIQYAELMQDFADAKLTAESVGWEGDFCPGSEPRLMALPFVGDDFGCGYAFVWKQDNNGSTFVISPVDLPWLAAHAMPGFGR